MLLWLSFMASLTYAGWFEPLGDSKIDKQFVEALHERILSNLEEKIHQKFPVKLRLLFKKALSNADKFYELDESLRLSPLIEYKISFSKTVPTRYSVILNSRSLITPLLEELKKKYSFKLPKGNYIKAVEMESNGRVSVLIQKDYYFFLHQKEVDGHWYQKKFVLKSDSCEVSPEMIVSWISCESILDDSGNEHRLGRFDWLTWTHWPEGAKWFFVFFTMISAVHASKIGWDVGGTALDIYFSP